MTLRPLILIIEKDEDLRQSLSSILHEGGYLVATTSPSRGVAKFVVAWPCDLVIIDIDRSNSDAAALAAEIHTQVPWLSILLLSDLPLSNRFMNGLDGRVFDFLLKPFELDELLDAVMGLLAGRIPAPSLARYGWADL